MSIPYFISRAFHARKQVLVIGLLLWSVGLQAQQQIAIPRIEQMNNMPQPYQMRNWKQVAKDYDNFVFDIDKQGAYLPITRISSNNGVNFPSIAPILMDTYVGHNDHGKTAEAINVMPAVVGASLVGIDKTTHLSTNWVVKLKDFFNSKNKQNVYLNNYSGRTGHDWWYEVMPNVFFYQLAELYPDADPDFATQLRTIADVQLGVLHDLGARQQPWTAPSMNYRAFNLLTRQPLATSVPQPETGGSIAWLLYQAYLETGDSRYLTGAESALDFLQGWSKNPSYEIQWPYGIAAAARLNAEQGTNYDLDKFINWAFSSGQGTLRSWGTIVGTWNGYDMSGLIGEANDKGDDYAFSMNGFQHAAALAPVAKYDKRYARALGKWILNVANASRLFYPDALPATHQQAASHAWAIANDPQACIPFESIKEKWSNISPFAMGDAVRGKWAATDLSMYSGSSVGYLAALIETTEVEGILQIDLNKTDFRRTTSQYPTYLYYNPYAEAKQVTLTLPTGAHNIYDAISEHDVQSNASGQTTIIIPADGIVLLTVYPAGSTVESQGRMLQVQGGGVLDYHYGYNFSSPVRIKSFSADKVALASPASVRLVCFTENAAKEAVYTWSVGAQVVPGATDSIFTWAAPEVVGVYQLSCTVTSAGHTVESDTIEIRVVTPGTELPVVSKINTGENLLHEPSSTFPLSAITSATAGTYQWTVSGGALSGANSPTPSWTLPSVEGVYVVSLALSNELGSTTATQTLLVRARGSAGQPQALLYFPFSGNAKNSANPGTLNGVDNNAIPTSDPRGKENQAYAFASANTYIYIPNDPTLNFTGKLSLSFWVKPDVLSNYEQFVVSHGSWEERYKASITPDKKLRWTLKTTSKVVDVDDPQALEPGKYVHYTCVYTGYSLELYRNGTLCAFEPLTGRIGTTGHSLTLARKDQATADYYLKGSIDEVRLYTQALDPSFIGLLPNLWDEATGILPVQASLRLQVYPNPTAGMLYVRTPILQELVELHVVNSQGLVVGHYKLLGAQDHYALSLAHLPHGVYVLRGKSVEGQIMSATFVVHSR